MLFYKSLPNKADIFIKTKKNTFYKKYYKPFKKIKILGITISGIFVLFSFAVLLVPGQQAAQAMFACHQTNVNGCNNWWNIQNNKRWHNQDWNQNQQGNTDVTIAPLNPIPANNFVVATSGTQIQPTVTPVPAINLSNQHQPTVQDIGGNSGQIIQVQQQILQQMQSCVSNAQQMANQISSLTNQQTQLQNQFNASYNQTMPNFDTSTTQGQQQQQAWQQQQQQQQQQLQNQLNALATAISNAQNNMNTASSNCQQQVSQLEQNRSQMESNLDNVFSTIMSNVSNPPVQNQ